MAAISETIQTFDRKGLRENLTDFIYNISPTDTPFMSNAGRKAKVTATLHEWQTDALDTADTTNAQIQGDDITTFASQAATVRVGNYTQISAKNAIVADTVEAVDKAGRKSEMAYQLAKRSKELKRDMESIFLCSQGGSAGNSSTAATLASMLAWVKTNVDYDDTTTPGVNPSWTSGVPSAARTDGTNFAISEARLKNVLTLGFGNGANFSTLMVGPKNKALVSAFDGVATKTYYQSAKEQSAIIGAADVYVGDFGTLAVVANRFQRESDGWLLDFSYLNIGFLRPFRTKDLAATGDAEKRLINVEYTLQVGTELSQGLIADLTT